MPSLERVKDILNQARKLNGAPREEFLSNACGDDPQVRSEVLSLLEADGRPGGIFAHPTLHSPGGSSGLSGDLSVSRAAVDRASSEPPGTRIGRYRIEKRIGLGGMGEVYLADQVEPVRRRVALKIIKPGMDTREVLARFEAERQALAMMDHPSVAKVLDAGATDAGRPYFVMEYVPGEPITAYCDRHKLPIRARLELFIQVCGAVQHAHQKGIIHRDIKPANILVSHEATEPRSHEGEPRPTPTPPSVASSLRGSVAVLKVIDFGVAKAISGKLTDATVETVAGGMIGTPAYMSPEQAEGSPDIDTRTDVYGLGVLLYELLTGVTPFDAERLKSAGLLEQVRIIREETPPRPSARVTRAGIEGPGETRTSRKVEKSKVADGPHRTLAKQLRGDLDCIVMKCLEKERTRRYESAAALAEEVRRHLDDEPVLAGAPGSLYRAMKFARRHKATVAAASLAAAFLIVGIIGTSWGMAEATTAKQSAIGERDAARLQFYIANIAAVEAALHRGENFAARRRLDEAPSEYRNWEWLFYHSLADRSLEVLATLPSSIFAMAIDRGGERLVTASSDRILRVWNLRGRAEALPLADHHDSVAAISPDGKQLAAGGADRSILIRDVASGRLVQKLEFDYGYISSIAFSPDGEILAVGGGTEVHRIHLWTTRDWRQLPPLGGHGLFVTSLAFDPRGSWLASASEDGTVKTWDLASKRALTTFEGHLDRVLCVAVSPDGEHIASGSGDNTVIIWDSASGAEIEVLRGHTDAVEHLAFSPDGARLFTGGWDDSIRMWDLEGDDEPVVLRGHQGPVTGVTLPADSAMLVTSSLDGTIRLWDSSSQPEVMDLRGHTGGVVSVGFSPDGSLLASGGRDGTVRLWNLRLGAEESKLAQGAAGVPSVAFSPDGSRLVSIAEGSEAATVWDVTSRRTIVRFRGHVPNPNGSNMTCAQFSPNGNEVASGGSDALIRIWDAAHGTERLKLTGHASVVAAIAFSPDGGQLASASGDGAVYLWDTGSGTRTHSLGNLEGATALAFSPDGRLLICGSDSNGLKAWTLADGCAVQRLTRSELHCEDVAFSPDGARIALACNEPAVRILDTASGMEVAALRSPRWEACCVAFSRDGRYLTAGLGQVTHAGHWPTNLLVWDSAPESVRSQERRSALQRQGGDGV